MFEQQQMPEEASPHPLAAAFEQQQMPVETSVHPLATADQTLPTVHSTPVEAILQGCLARLQADHTDSNALSARLAELMAGYQELDSTPEEAARSAVRHLESELQAEANKRQAQALHHKARSSSRSARASTRTALKLFGAGALATVAMTPFFIGSTSALLYNLMMFMFFGLPLLLGIAQGIRARERPMLGAFYAIALLIPMASLASELIMDIFTRYQREGWMLGLDLALFWLPIGCLTAGVTGKIRDARRKRRALPAAAQGRLPEQAEEDTVAL